MRPQVGQVVNNKYKLIRVIGDGGMGSVYEARHEVLGTTVALKFLHPELSRRQGLVQRFLQEARVSAQIQSPHVVRVSDVDQTSANLAFIVMEYLEGKSLQTLYEDLYQAGQRLSYGDALEYAMQMLEGVEAAHRAGVVHRDLKPDNVMITRTAKGEPLLKVLDFGIAKLKVTGELDRGLTRPGVIMGTPEYMAPEQAYSADAVDARADIFSLGVMIFEMLAGRRPVGGDEPHQIASSYLTGQIAQLTDLAPHVPPELASVIHRAMGPKPSDRYGSVAEFRAALDPFANAAKVPSAGGIPTHIGTPPPPAVSPQNAAMPTAAQSPVAAASPIPKTLPPTDDQPPPGVTPAAAASAPAATPASPVSIPGAVPTPFGGFDAPQSPVGAHGTSLAEPLAQGLTPANPSGSPPVEGTVQATPLPAAIGGYDPSPRPGGTAMGLPVMEQQAAAAMQNAGYAQAPQNTYAPAGAYGHAPGGGYGPPPGQGYAPNAPTTPMNPLSGGAPGYQQNKRERGGGASIALMLLLALLVSGIVVGGIYLGQKLTHNEDGGTEPLVTQLPPTTVVPVDQTTSRTTTPGPLYTNQLPTTAATPRPTTPSTGKPPATNPTGTGGPQPSSTASTTPTFPGPFGSGIPTIPWPTSIPLPTFFPGQNPPPTSTGSSPTPTSTGSSSPNPTSSRPRIIIPVPGKKP